MKIWKGRSRRGVMHKTMVSPFFFSHLRRSRSSPPSSPNTNKQSQLLPPFGECVRKDDVNGGVWEKKKKKKDQKKGLRSLISNSKCVSRKKKRSFGCTVLLHLLPLVLLENVPLC